MTDGRHFRIQDDDGRSAQDVLADVTGARGLGAAAHTVAASGSAGRPTEILSDPATGLAVVHEPGRAHWWAPATRFLPVVRQLFVPSTFSAWQPVGTGARLGRLTTEFASEVSGEADGRAYSTRFRWSAAGPYLLSRQAQDCASPGISVTVEVTDIAEGVVTAADLTSRRAVSWR
ncbi:hypothetical protein [Kineosporia babensis]|uniref:Uncharacterized protein n=1 Tax=Kineosporia babensis TaxID=499548 RepID=A0A9X1SST3_9ACTN|nr:hypothetical protein [Kineosporia babensis]MCD5310646.1 hypothetical protein [Kineosporia babensis]